MEANARLQVEHTVTEQVTGIDLVQTQLRIAQGATLAELGLADAADERNGIAPRGYAVQTRVHTETLGEDGTVRPTGGVLTAYEQPSGPGVRTDGFGYVGYETNPAYDPLLAKVIAHSPSARFGDALTRASRALSESGSKACRRTSRSCRTCWRTRTWRWARCTRAGWTRTSRRWRRTGRRRGRGSFRRRRPRRIGDCGGAGGQQRSAGAVRARIRR